MGKYTLKLTSSVVVDGAIRRSGSVVGVDEQLARELMRRGKAELADIEPNGELQDGGDQKTDLSEMSKVQLIAVAEGLEIQNAVKMNKIQLLDAINKYQETEQ